MRSKSIHEPSGKSSRPEPIDQTDPLTEEQKTFAGVLGRALADAWRCKWRRRQPHLRLIDDETFNEAQRLLRINEDKNAGSRKERGRLNGSKSGADGSPPRHLLSQLIVCGHCGRVLHVGGTGGKYFFCPGYAKGICECKTPLRRDRAERMILDEIGRRILTNASWRQRALEETLKAWKAQEATVPSELAAASRRLTEVERKITNLLDRILIEAPSSDVEKTTAKAPRRRSAKKA